MNLSKTSVWRGALVGFGAILLLWLSVGVTADLTLDRRNLKFVEFVWPDGSQSLVARAGGVLLASASQADALQAYDLSRRALAREPVSAAAAAAMGTAANVLGWQAQALRIFSYSQSVSRRDLPTQLWLIEYSVSKGDIPGALRHYDVALRTRTAASDLLLPILAQASAGRQVEQALFPYLARKRNWWPAYLDALIASKPAPDSLARQVQQLRLDPRRPEELRRLSAAMQKLASQGQYDLAYSLVPVSLRSPHGVRNGGFESEPMLLPFDWWFREESDMSAFRDAGRGAEGAFVLRVAIKGQQEGEVAHQLLHLRPGHYVLSGLYGGLGVGGSAKSTIEIACTSNNDNKTIKQVTLEPSPRNTISVRFDVADTGCRAQWLRLIARSNADSDFWVDGFQVSRE